MFSSGNEAIKERVSCTRHMKNLHKYHGAVDTHLKLFFPYIPPNACFTQRIGLSGGLDGLSRFTNPNLDAVKRCLRTSNHLCRLGLTPGT